MRLGFSLSRVQGISYELNKHAGGVAGVGYLEEGQELLSLGQDGLLVAWDMTVKRKQVCECEVL